MGLTGRGQPVEVLTLLQAARRSRRPTSVRPVYRLMCVGPIRIQQRLFRPGSIAGIHGRELLRSGQSAALLYELGLNKIRALATVFGS